MPEIQLAYLEMIETKAVMETKLQEHSVALSKYPLQQVWGTPAGVFVPFFGPIANVDFFNRMNQYNEHVNAIQYLENQLKNLESYFILDHLLPQSRAYSWAIPNDQAIETISKYGPIIEIGAGSGFWAKLLAEQGVDIVAYDNGSYDRIADLKYTKKWFDVKLGDETAVLQNSGRTLMLCWPPTRSEYASKALSLYEGEFVIYVGERRNGTATGTPALFDALDRDFEILEAVSIPTWPGYTDQVFVYIRKNGR